jgi:hypothetical protein
MIRLIFILTVLLCVCFTGCANTAGESVETYIPISPADIPAGQALLQNIEQAAALAQDLAGFTWQDMEGLGYWEMQETGQACLTYRRIYSENESPGLYSGTIKWIPIYDILPAREQVKPLIQAISACRAAAADLNSMQVADGENTVLLEGLDSILKTAVYLAETLSRTGSGQFNEIKLTLLESSEKTRDRYLGKFSSQSDRYTQLLQNLIANLTAAQTSLEVFIGEG